MNLACLIIPNISQGGLGKNNTSVLYVFIFLPAYSPVAYIQNTPPLVIKDLLSSESSVFVQATEMKPKLP